MKKTIKPVKAVKPVVLKTNVKAGTIGFGPFKRTFRLGPVTLAGEE